MKSYDLQLDLQEEVLPKKPRSIFDNEYYDQVTAGQPVGKYGPSRLLSDKEIYDNQSVLDRAKQKAEKALSSIDRGVKAIVDTNWIDVGKNLYEEAKHGLGEDVQYASEHNPLEIGMKQATGAVKGFTQLGFDIGTGALESLTKATQEGLDIVGLKESEAYKNLGWSDDKMDEFQTLYRDWLDQHEGENLSGFLGQVFGSGAIVNRVGGSMNVASKLEKASQISPNLVRLVQKRAGDLVTPFSREVQAGLIEGVTTGTAQSFAQNDASPEVWLQQMALNAGFGVLGDYSIKGTSEILKASKRFLDSSLDLHGTVNHLESLGVDPDKALVYVNTLKENAGAFAQGYKKYFDEKDNVNTTLLSDTLFGLGNAMSKQAEAIKKGLENVHNNSLKSQHETSTRNNAESTAMAGTQSAEIPRLDFGDAQEISRQEGGKLLGSNGKRSRSLINEEVKKILESKKDEEITEADKTVLREYTGAGGKESTGAEGRGLLDEYFTPTPIVKKMWGLARQYGFNGGSVLEPSVGVGRFIEHAPERHKLKITGAEINETSARISKILYPEATILKQPFEEFFINKENKSSLGDKVEGTHKLIIGNPPYGKHRGRYGAIDETGIGKYEEYFIKRGLDLLEENGLLVYVVPSSFLRNGPSSAKERIAKSGGFLLDAYRLPSGVFEDTEIGTDIVVFKKEKLNQTDEKVQMRVQGMSNNSFFDREGYRVLGEEGVRSGRFGEEKYIKGSIDDLNKIEIDESRFKDIEEYKQDASQGKQEEVKTEIRKNREDIIIKGTKKVSGTSKYTKDLDQDEVALWKNRHWDGSLTGSAPLNKANYMSGKYYADFDYYAGDIYKKIEAVNKDLLNNDDPKLIEKLEKQKEQLQKILPQPKQVNEIYLTPLSTVAEEIQTEGQTLKEAFKDYVEDIPRDMLEDSAAWEIKEYVDQTPVRGSDKIQNQEIRKRRRRIGDKLFQKFYKEVVDGGTKEKLERLYNRRFNAVVKPDYTKMPFFAEGLSNTFKGAELEVLPHQIEAVGFLKTKGVGIVAHDVGLGKTMSGIISVNEMMNAGWTKRPLIIVPNGVYDKWIKEIQELYPDRNIVGLGNLGANYKVDKSMVIEEGDIAIMTYEGMNKLGFNESTYFDLQQNLQDAFTDISGENKSKRQEALEKASFEKKMGTAEAGTEYIFENFNFDALLIDELHNFKNIFEKAKSAATDENGSKIGEYRNLQGSSSARGVKLFFMAQYILDKMNGRNVLGLTATPFTNNPIEIYNILSLFAKPRLEELGLANINDFISTFMEMKDTMVVKAGGNVQESMVVQSFQNLKALQDLIKEYIDFKTGEELPEIVKARPTKHVKNYTLSATEEQIEYIGKAEKLMDDKDTGGVLAAITEMRMITLSPYLSRYYHGATPTTKEFIENSPKIRLAMEMIKANKGKAGGQIIYMPLGTEHLPRLKDYLIEELGFKKHEVDIISGSVSLTKKEIIKDKFNNGEVKVVIGTDTIKEGLDLQKTSTDLYILSYPWRPTDLIQLHGRLWRQGNEWEHVRIHNMTLEDTIDSFMSQKLGEKTKRIENIWSYKGNVMASDEMDFDAMKLDLIRDPVKRVEVEKFITMAELRQKEKAMRAEKAYTEELLDGYEKADKEIADLERKLEWRQGMPSYELRDLERNLKKAKAIKKRIGDKKDFDRLEAQDTLERIKTDLEGVESKLEKLNEEFEEKKKNAEREQLTWVARENDFKTPIQELLKENETLLTKRPKKEVIIPKREEIPVKEVADAPKEVMTKDEDNQPDLFSVKQEVPQEKQAPSAFKKEFEVNGSGVVLNPHTEEIRVDNYHNAELRWAELENGKIAMSASANTSTAGFSSGVSEQSPQYNSISEAKEAGYKKISEWLQSEVNNGASSKNTLKKLIAKIPGNEEAKDSLLTTPKKKRKEDPSFESLETQYEEQKSLFDTPEEQIIKEDKKQAIYAGIEPIKKEDYKTPEALKEAQYKKLDEIEKADNKAEEALPKEVVNPHEPKTTLKALRDSISEKLQRDIAQKEAVMKSLLGRKKTTGKNQKMMSEDLYKEIQSLKKQLSTANDPLRYEEVRKNEEVMKLRVGLKTLQEDQITLRKMLGLDGQMSFVERQYAEAMAKEYDPISLERYKNLEDEIMHKKGELDAVATRLRDKLETDEKPISELKKIAGLPDSSVPLSSKELFDLDTFKKAFVKAYNMQLRKITRDAEREKEFFEQRLEKEKRDRMQAESRILNAEFEKHTFEMQLDKIQSRKHKVRAVKRFFELPDHEFKKIGGNQNVLYMTQKEFDEFLPRIKQKAEEVQYWIMRKGQLLSMIEEQEFKKVDNLRQALEIKNPLQKMTLEEIEQVESALKPFQHGDTFLGPRMIQTIANTDIGEVKTVRELKMKMLADAGVKTLGEEKVSSSVFDDMTYDAHLQDKNPLFRVMVKEYFAHEIEEKSKAEEVRSKLNELLKKSRDSRAKLENKPMLKKITDSLIPQDTMVFDYLEAKDKGEIAMKMTNEEMELASYLQNLFTQYRDRLVEKGTLKRYRHDYITHVQRGFLEALKDEGFGQAIRDFWKSETVQKVDFEAIGATGEVLGLEKFFKFAQSRTGGLKPSKNLGHTVMAYTQSFYKKEALDAMIPKIEAYSYWFADGKAKRFIKEWVNNKKGRRQDYKIQGTPLDLFLRGLKMGISFMDLGFNVVVGLSSSVGNIMANVVGMEMKQYKNGVLRFHSKQGHMIVEKYKGMFGQSVWENLSNAENDIGTKVNTLAFSLLEHFAHQSKLAHFLGKLTDEEWKTGDISKERLAEIKLDIAKTHHVGGMESLAGNTTLGSMFTMYKKWAIPFLFTLSKDMGNFVKSRALRQPLQASDVRLFKGFVVAGAVYLFWSAVFGEEDDQSFTGKIKQKIRQESLSSLSAINPETWTSAPRMWQFIQNLTDSFAMLARLEAYKTNGASYKKGDLKGLEKLKRTFTPGALRQVQGGFTSDQQKETDLDLNLDLDLDLNLDLNTEVTQ